MKLRNKILLASLLTTAMSAGFACPGSTICFNNNLSYPVNVTANGHADTPIPAHAQNFALPAATIIGTVADCVGAETNCGLGFSGSAGDIADIHAALHISPVAFNLNSIDHVSSGYNINVDGQPLSSLIHQSLLGHTISVA